MENFKEFKREIVSIIENIGKFIEKEDFESLKDFYSEIVFEHKYKNKLKILDKNPINESAIYNIIKNKYYLAKNEKIDFELDVRMDFKKMDMKPYELAKILGIFLDNAIEATKICKKKYIFLSLVSESDKDTIKIYNTYDNTKKVEMDKIFLKGYSTKKGNTGLGLWEIKKILLKHTNLDLYTRKEENIFIQEFSIYHDSKKENVEEKTTTLIQENHDNDLKLTKDTIITLRHDFNNILQAIEGYIGKNDFEGLKAYYSDLLIDCEWMYIKR